MLNKVKLTNFQRHRSLEVTMTGGLTALRGSNEAGKSTLLRAICYALFGVKALGESLDETVSWGEPVNTLKVELEFASEGVTYTVTRGKSGAEVNYDGGIVTGQTEVTAFICRLLKVDAGAASRLMLSNQNQIRGALESGTKATTELIEQLAEFDQIDNLIELMQVKLALGSAAGAEAALVRAQEQMDSAAELAKAPDLAALEGAVSDAALAHKAAAASLDVAKKWEAEAQEAHSQVRERAVARAALERDAERADLALDKAQGLVAKLSAVKAPDNAAARADALRAEIEGASGYQKVKLLYAQAKPYLSHTNDGVLFVGGSESLTKALLVEEQELKALQIRQAELDGDERLLKAQITHGSCTFCGKDFSGVPEVALKNADTQAKLDGVVAAKVEVAERLRFHAASLANLQKCSADSQPRLKFLAANPTLVEFDGLSMPPTLKWVGPDVSADAPNVEQMRSDLAKLLDDQKGYDAAQAQLAAARTQLAEAHARAQTLTTELEETPVVTTAETQAKLDTFRESTRTATGQERAAREHLLDAERAVKDAKEGHSRALAALESAREAVAARRSEIKTLEFNNALMKRVKQARPLIADKLWALVLHAVSTYFSEVRGVKSKVTKDSDGFKVDGHTVSTLSGSTLDALGLAIRVALVRTFLPSAPFLILDEPGSGMDDDRTNNMLGFLASCGFGQVILVTHEDISESVADNVIEL